MSFSIFLGSVIWVSFAIKDCEKREIRSGKARNTNIRLIRSIDGLGKKGRTKITFELEEISFMQKTLQMKEKPLIQRNEGSTLKLQEKFIKKSNIE